MEHAVQSVIRSLTSTLNPLTVKVINAGKTEILPFTACGIHWHKPSTINKVGCQAHPYDTGPPTVITQNNKGKKSQPGINDFKCTDHLKHDRKMTLHHLTSEEQLNIFCLESRRGLERLEYRCVRLCFKVTYFPTLLLLSLSEMKCIVGYLNTSHVWGFLDKIGLHLSPRSLLGSLHTWILSSTWAENDKFHEESRTQERTSTHKTVLGVGNCQSLHQPYFSGVVTQWVQ